MSSRKYVPPHLRRDSARKPPPTSTNDSFLNSTHYNIERRNRRNKFSQSSRTYRSNRYNENTNICNNNRFQSTFNNLNTRITLKETEEYEMKDEIETIELDEYIIYQKKCQQITIQIISEYTDQDTAKLIIEFCNDFMILIPNTFNCDEFLKYWFVVGKGPLINEYRDYQRVDLYPNYLQLIRRGSIASIKGYKPSKTAKLKLECKFIYRHSKEGMRFSFKSNGVRDKTSIGGDVYTEGTFIAINGPMGRFGNSLHANKIFVKEYDEEFVEEKEKSISPAKMNKELSVSIIDDGEKIEIKYIDDKVYLMECNSTYKSNATGLYRVMLYNRRDQGRISDITYLQLSIVTEDAQTTKE